MSNVNITHETNSVWFYRVTYFFFILFFIWWLLLNVPSFRNEEYAYYFTSSYSIVALFGGLLGILASKNWGGRDSFMGKTILLFSIALILQFLFQISYTIYYYVFNIEDPYPSFGDFFFLLSVWFYALAAKYTYKIFPKQFRDKNKKSIRIASFFAGMITLVYSMLIIRYFYSDAFSLSLTFEIKRFIDLATAFANIIFLYYIISSAILASKYISGRLKLPIHILLVSAIFHYISDLVFLVNYENWEPARYDDLLILLSYIGIAFAFSKFSNSFNSIVDSHIKLKMNESKMQDG